MDKSLAYTPLKILHDLDRLKNLREGKLVPPKTIRIDLNTICNHNCPFCLYQSNADGLRGIGLNEAMPDGRQIDSNRLIELLGEFKECGVNAVVFLGGGEPTIHPQLERIIASTDEIGLEYGIISNGSRLDRVAPYKDSPLFKWVRVSLDAANETTWIKIHQPKNLEDYGFEHVLKNIHDLKNPRVDFLRGISLIVGTENYQEIYDFIELGKSLGIDNVRIGLEYGRGFGDRHSEIISTALEQIAKGKRDFETRNFQVFDRVSSRQKDISKNKDYSLCRFKEITTNLGADLKLYTCCFGKYSESHAIGSLKEMSFRELWFEKRKEFLERFNISKCPPCWYGNTNRVLEYLSQENPPHSNFID